MQSFRQCLAALGFLGAMAAGSVAAAPVEWDYEVSAQFLTSAVATTFNGAGPGTSNGCELVSATDITWGACSSGPAGVGRSGIGISDSPKTGTLVTNGAAQPANTYTHANNLVSSAHGTLASATIATTLGIRRKDSGDPYTYETFTYTIRFSETPNNVDATSCVVPSETPCSDIWVLDGSVNRTIVFGGDEFVFSFFPAPAANPLPDAYCAAANAESGCIGFTTVEGEANAIPFLLNLTQTAAVSGRVYAEGSTPANTQDDGQAVDAGSAVDVSLACTEPSYSAGPVATAADGSFSFEGVPVGASCTISTAPPAGWQAAYTQQGLTGSAADPGSLDTSVAGSTSAQTIVIDVPSGGSSGNLFAWRAVSDMQSSTVCTPGSAAAGTLVVCTTTCSNIGSSTALNAFCSISNAASLPGSPSPVCTGPAAVPSQGVLSCTVSFKLPASGSVTVLGATGADNDSNGGSDGALGNNPSSAAVSTQTAAPTPVPTLGVWALLLLAALLGGLAWDARRRL
ncbi:THxN family PEP-CTERM protein [Comamonas sp. JUb58]|uniref:THxN family PEP-CTERM protein n=1 Tax=Comamonas sp. JUb58 TaxID=2485114 RepID=UPI0010D6139A|nr:THxN family PEP-CTERM protein [Comamonas sp. JUb58]TDS85228.1 putative secreted protein (IPTL-CTERM system target) [Comamonas sp. JUb58]